MTVQLDRELKRLIVGTNDQRRRVGQTVYHLYRTLIFWNARGKGFWTIVRSWAVGGAAIFDSLATSLRDLEVFDEDRALRSWLAPVLEQLARDLERGDTMLHPFLRWLETRFPTLTALMGQERSGSRIWDFDLARLLTRLFAQVSEAERGAAVSRLREVARALGEEPR